MALTGLPFSEVSNLNGLNRSVWKVTSFLSDSAPGEYSPWPHLLVRRDVCLVTQLSPTLWESMDCRPPGSSVHGDSPGKNTGVGCHALLQGIFSTQGSNPGLIQVSRITGGLSTIWATREAPTYRNKNVVFLEKEETVSLYLFLNQHSYSLSFQYHQVFTYERLPGLWINVNKSTQVFIKNKINNSHSLLPISQTLPEPVRLNNFPDAKHLELTQGSCFRLFSFLSNLGASHVDVFINTHLHDGGKVETTADFIFLGSKITADGNCSHEIKRYLLLESKANDKPRQHIKKQR